MKKKDLYTFSKTDADIQDEKSVWEYLNDYGECRISKKELMKHISAEQYLAFQTDYKKMKEYRMLKTSNIRNMQVIYITGPAGQGKSTLARYIADNINHYDYFVTGTGDDILDGYDKEECIIFDDARGSVMKPHEFLHFTDNNTNSSIKSRYVNKDIGNCKLMLLTSIKKPNEFYSFMMEQEDDDGNKIPPEDCDQFYRRFAHKFLEVNNREDAPRIYSIDKNGKIEYTGEVFYKTMKEIYEELGINPNKEPENSFFKQFAKKDDEEYPF